MFILYILFIFLLLERCHIYKWKVYYKISILCPFALIHFPVLPMKLTEQNIDKALGYRVKFNDKNHIIVPIPLPGQYNIQT